MALSGKYGKLDIPHIESDEPVFILRAQDRLAEFIMHVYMMLAASHHSKAAREVVTEIDLFRSWKGKRKMPG